MAIDFNKYRQSWDTVSIHPEELLFTDNNDRQYTTPQTYRIPYHVDTEDIEHFDFEEMLLDFVNEECQDGEQCSSLFNVHPAEKLRDNLQGFIVEWEDRNGLYCLIIRITINDFNVCRDDLEKMFPSVF